MAALLSKKYDTVMQYRRSVKFFELRVCVSGASHSREHERWRGITKFRAIVARHGTGRTGSMSSSVLSARESNAIAAHVDNRM